MASRRTLLSANNYHYPRGGAEVVFLEHNKLFMEKGWDVVPFCMKHPNNLPSDWERYFVEEIEFGSDYSLMEKFIKAPKTIYSFEARRKVSQLIDSVRPDIFHAHNIYHHISPSILGEVKGHDIPTVMTLHDLKLVCPAYKMHNSGGICEKCKGGKLSQVVKNRCVKESLALSGLVYIEALTHRLLRSYEKYVDMFVVPSRFFKEKFIEWGIDEKRLTFIPNFLDMKDYQPSSVRSDEFVYFGRLGPEKGLETLIRAAALAGVPVKLIGTGPLEARVRSLAGELGVDLRLTGYLSGPALRDEISRGKCVVLPSEWYENAPLSVLEAYALGKPVIGSNIGGIPELIVPDQTGYLFEAGSAQGLADRMLNVKAKTVEELSWMGEHASNLVKANHSQDACYRQLSGLYERLGLASLQLDS